MLLNTVTQQVMLASRQSLQYLNKRNIHAFTHTP